MTKVDNQVTNFLNIKTRVSIGIGKLSRLKKLSTEALEFVINITKGSELHLIVR